ncbi:hypothetical protein L1887_50893 [Cichorium endivia]|nr:hypothetical protein L1887_50893 [Cichorium endivia]
MAAMVVDVDEQASLEEFDAGFREHIDEIGRDLLVADEAKKRLDGRVEEEHAILTFEAEVVVVQMQDERRLVLAMAPEDLASRPAKSASELPPCTTSRRESFRADIEQYGCRWACGWAAAQAYTGMCSWGVGKVVVGQLVELTATAACRNAHSEPDVAVETRFRKPSLGFVDYEMRCHLAPSHASTSRPRPTRHHTLPCTSIVRTATRRKPADERIDALDRLRAESNVGDRTGLAWVPAWSGRTMPALWLGVCSVRPGLQHCPCHQCSIQGSAPVEQSHLDCRQVAGPRAHTCVDQAVRVLVPTGRVRHPQGDQAVGSECTSLSPFALASLVLNTDDPIRPLTTILIGGAQQAHLLDVERCT